MKTYDVILADPPWRFHTYSGKGMKRAADNHYDTMDLEQICSLEIPAAKHCTMFLWTTAPTLPEAMSVLSSWGFQYKSQLVWDKRVMGLGYYVRNVHEILLIATKGKPRAPKPANRPESLMVERKRQHSRKPEVSYELIERMYPEARRLEMFARQVRPGWDAWGNETDKFQQAAE